MTLICAAQIGEAGHMLTSRSVAIVQAGGSMAQITKGPGGDGGGTEAYPDNYVVKAPAVPDGPPSFVDVEQGRLEGIEANGVRYFRGVPFARPPVGPLRFKAPQPAEAWSGTRRAIDNPAASLQPTTILEAPSTSEDCLYLNIWAPSKPGPHPVYVYIHGGGNTSGYSLEHRVNGASFARDGIVCINIAYRLGIFGFLELGEVLGEEYRGSGNNAFRDLLAALEWIKTNVAAFGGDPGRVTIGGQSAGAFNVCALMASPKAKGLFRGAISQSGGGQGVATLPVANARAAEFVKHLEGGGRSAPELLTMSGPELMDLQSHVKMPTPAGVVDGAVFTALPVSAIGKGQGQGVALLIGADREEMAVLGGANVASWTDAEKTAFKTYAGVNPNLAYDQLTMRFASAKQFTGQSLVFADRHAAAGGATYVYNWTWHPQTGRFKGQAFHGIEQPFVWDNLRSIAFRYVEPEPNLQPRAKTLHTVWCNFIKLGRPVDPEGHTWAEWTPNARTVTEVGDMIRSIPVRIDELELWRRMFE